MVFYVHPGVHAAYYNWPLQSCGYCSAKGLHEPPTRGVECWRLQLARRSASCRLCRQLPQSVVLPSPSLAGQQALTRTLASTGQ